MAQADSCCPRCTLSDRDVLMRLAPEAGFIGRVYKTTAVVSVIFALPIAGYFGSLSVINFALGVALGLALLRLLELTTERAIKVGERRAPTMLALLAACKYIVIAAGFYALAVNGWMRPIFLAGGYALTHLVIVLKVVGRAMVKRWAGELPEGPPSAGAASGES